MLRSVAVLLGSIDSGSCCHLVLSIPIDKLSERKPLLQHYLGMPQGGQAFSSVVNDAEAVRNLKPLLFLLSRTCPQNECSKSCSSLILKYRAVRVQYLVVQKKRTTPKSMYVTGGTSTGPDQPPYFGLGGRGLAHNRGGNSISIRNLVILAGFGLDVE